VEKEEEEEEEEEEEYNAFTYQVHLVQCTDSTSSWQWMTSNLSRQSTTTPNCRLLQDMLLR